MQPSTNFLEGKTSRSLKGAFLVSREKLAPGVGHLDGGIVAWCEPLTPTFFYLLPIECIVRVFRLPGSRYFGS